MIPTPAGSVPVNTVSYSTFKRTDKPVSYCKLFCLHIISLEATVILQASLVEKHVLLREIPKRTPFKYAHTYTHKFHAFISYYG